MNLENKTIFVSGANRGIGKAIVEALLKKGVKKIYAAARDTKNLPNFGDARVVPVKLDITNADQIKSAAAEAGDVNVLINNAGIATFTNVLANSSEELQNDMSVNYFGTLQLTRALLPAIEKQSEKGGGAIANVISVVGLASMAAIGGYSASKAALFSATQAMRGELKAKNITVHGIFPGPIDTDMAKDFDFPKTSPQVTAENIIAGITAGTEDIFPDPMSTQVGELWAQNPKEVERQFAAM